MIQLTALLFVAVGFYVFLKLAQASEPDTAPGDGLTPEDLAQLRYMESDLGDGEHDV